MNEPPGTPVGVATAARGMLEAEVEGGCIEQRDGLWHQKRRVIEESPQ